MHFDDGLNLENLAPRELESLCRINGYSHTFIATALFIGYTKDDHVIYKCIFSCTYDTPVGVLYVWRNDNGEIKVKTEC